MHDKTRVIVNIVKRYWLCVFAIGSGIILHFGTAILRVRSFFPSPALIDFSAFYASAAAMRRGISPYGISTEWLASLQSEMLIPHQPPAIFNLPLWSWLLQPLAALRYPSAAWLWLLGNIGLLLFVTHSMHQEMTAANRNQPASIWLSRYDLLFTSFPLFIRALILLAVIVTFGPVFLDLSIGQTSVLLLAMCILAGLQLHAEDSWGKAWIMGLAVGLATVAKLYPAAWLVPLAMLRRWKQFAASVVLTSAALGAGFLLHPDSNRAYWQEVLPKRLNTAAEQVSLDDQSMVSYLDRIFRPHTYNVPGLETGEREQIIWEPGWTLDKQGVQIIGYTLCGLSGFAVFYVLLQSDGKHDQGGFYLWVLYILVVFPHMERYNHVLLLPAMIWLWLRGQYKLVAVVYLLAGLSRLNHLWVTLLPAPWSPLASGFGLFAVLALMGGILIEFKSRREVTGSA